LLGDQELSLKNSKGHPLNEKLSINWTWKRENLRQFFHMKYQSINKTTCFFS
jgi:hypothetical protein